MINEEVMLVEAKKQQRQKDKDEEDPPVSVTMSVVSSDSPTGWQSIYISFPAEPFPGPVSL